MNKIDWISKLSSRKFYLALGVFVTDMIICFGGSSELAAQITAIITSAGAVIAYIFTEGKVDAARAQANTIVIPGYEADEPEDDEDEDVGNE